MPRLRMGEDPATVLASLVEPDPGRDQRQFHDHQTRKQQTPQPPRPACAFRERDRRCAAEKSRDQRRGAGRERGARRWHRLGRRGGHWRYRLGRRGGHITGHWLAARQCVQHDQCREPYQEPAARRPHPSSPVVRSSRGDTQFVRRARGAGPAAPVARSAALLRPAAPLRPAALLRPAVAISPGLGCHCWLALHRATMGLKPSWIRATQLAALRPSANPMRKFGGHVEPLSNGSSSGRHVVISTQSPNCWGSLRAGRPVGCRSDTLAVENVVNGRSRRCVRRSATDASSVREPRPRRHAQEHNPCRNRPQLRHAARPDE